MTPPAFDHNKIAPPASSPGACAIGGRRFPLLASAATLSIIDNQHQTDSHSRGGAPLGLRCDYRPAVGGMFVLLPNLAGAFIGSGPFVNLRRQPRRQALADLLPSHFFASVRYVHQRSPGARNEVPHTRVFGTQHDR
jgi:hypothetical protein